MGNDDVLNVVILSTRIAMTMRIEKTAQNIGKLDFRKVQKTGVGNLVLKATYHLYPTVLPVSHWPTIKSMTLAA